MQQPTIGRIVIYRSRTGNYAIPAVITATQESLWPEGVERGDVPGLSSPTHVHLHVFTPGAQVGYQEHDVPFDPPVMAEDGSDAGVVSEQAPGSWRWPTIR